MNRVIIVFLCGTLLLLACSCAKDVGCTPPDVDGKYKVSVRYISSGGDGSANGSNKRAYDTTFNDFVDLSYDAQSQMVTFSHVCAGLAHGQVVSTTLRLPCSRGNKVGVASRAGECPGKMFVNNGSTQALFGEGSMDYQYAFYTRDDSETIIIKGTR